METETASCQMMFWTFLSFGDFLNNQTFVPHLAKGLLIHYASHKKFSKIKGVILETSRHQQGKPNAFL